MLSLTLTGAEDKHRLVQKSPVRSFEGVEWAEVLVDMLALAGYGAAHLAAVVGTSVPFCKVGEPFELATLGATVLNTPVPVHPSQIETASSKPEKGLLLRLLRDGLSATLPTIAFASYWNALEREAEDESKRRHFQRKVKCKNCGYERTEGWDLKRTFKEMYSEAGLDPSLFDKHRAKRGVIQHGSKLRTVGYLNEILQDLSQVQVTAILAVAKNAGIQPQTNAYMSTNWPVVVFSCCAQQNREFEIQLKRMNFQFSAGVLPKHVCGEAKRTTQAGVLLPPQIDPISVPPIQE
jgi:hypothetical protein